MILPSRFPIPRAKRHRRPGLPLFPLPRRPQVMTLSVNLPAPRGTIPYRRLFSYRAERLEGEYDAGFGIDMIRLAASSTSPLDAVQAVHRPR